MPTSNPLKNYKITVNGSTTAYTFEEHRHQVFLLKTQGKSFTVEYLSSKYKAHFKPQKNNKTKMVVKSNTKIIYLAGKISGESLATCTMKFGAAQHHWQAKGYEVLNPLQIVNGWKTPWQEAMRYCIQALCMATHIYFLSDWSQSKGAKIEHQLAKDLGIKIIYQKK